MSPWASFTHVWRTMPNHGMTPHISGTTLSAQARYAAGAREILECWFVGYRIHPAFHRRGYAGESVAALIDYLIAEHDTHRFVGVVASPNEASKAVLRLLGFRHEGHFRESFRCGGEWLDDDYFALLASEWRARPA